MSSEEKNIKSEQKADALPKQIKKAVKGLFYMSETDAPIQVFAGSEADAVTQENLLSQIGKETDTPVETRDFEEFFSQLTTIQDWFGDEEKATSEKYARLKDLLKNNLKDLTVFRIGSEEIDIFIVGIDSQGKLTGIKTQAVET